MRSTPAVLTLLLLSVATLAVAAPPGGSNEEVQGVSFFTYDQHGQKHTYLIKCANQARTLPECRGPSVWEDMNKLSGLQTSKVYAGRWFEPDVRTLG